MATELAISIIFLAFLGYLLGKLINDFVAMIGMLLGAFFGLAGGLYKIYKKAK